ncbi:hypothetical protein N0V94_008507 [Neodidymelliopsis sp. IMI 364377]|nr:hypothetical protein N0V94_008507 [Neodidymelliopsis sp. IMI 364377]
MLIAGALVAGGIFLFLLRRQKRRYAESIAAYSRRPAPYTGHTGVPEKGATVTAMVGSSIDDLLPQPAEDDAITGDLSKIRDNIKNHVRTYYHSGHVSAVDISESGIREIAAITDSDTTVIVDALLNASTRDAALRSLVGSVILTRCTGERSPSLLPDKLDELLSYISLNGSNKSQLVLFSKWKTITGALLQQRFGKQSKDPGRAQNFEDVVKSLDAVLAPFVKGSVDGGQRRKNLDMILTRAANFAFLLFAQPGSFHFDFSSHQSDLVVFPALVQTVDDQGQPLTSAKVLTEQEVVAA